MCGIVAVLARPARRPALSTEQVVAAVTEAQALLTRASERDRVAGAGRSQLLRQATAVLEALSSGLKGVPGLVCVLGTGGARPALEAGTARLSLAVASLEKDLDAGELPLGAQELEDVSSALVGLNDALWALGHDRLAAADGVAELSRSLCPQPGPAALGVLWAVHVALRSLDRLEVRGRDSAGVHLMLAGHGLGLSSREHARAMASRGDGLLFTSLSARAEGGCLSLVYKTAAEIGELGDNVAALRRALAGDELLAQALCSPEVRATVVAHTRWASVGLVSEANAHPLNSDLVGHSGPYVVGVVNGDIDNYAELIASEGLAVPPGITTDAKALPTLVSHYLGTGEPPGAAFHHAVERFEGSVGIALNMAVAPDELWLALKGSGQGLDVGLTEDAFVVASEAYGVVEEASSYLRLDGEHGGQVVRLTRYGAGSLPGIERSNYDGSFDQVAPCELTHPQITTRDVDRRGYRHFLLKELFEAPGSVRKTLRGKLRPDASGRLTVDLGDEAVPPALARALAAGSVRNVIVIGQGTAAVAGQAVAAAIGRGRPDLTVKAMPATELSGWGPLGSGLPDDMSGTLVVAVSQSGTTADTNRTVDLVRARGAWVVAIVNRRSSDLVQKSHGVLYTSDGRDIEMSVASTKAFYSQVVAGHLLALALAAAEDRAVGAQGSAELVQALRDLPARLSEVLASRADIAKVAAALAPSRRSWAVVGSGPADRVAAAEIRIKLSELCYKAVALDAIEDKKHIDLSAEPLIVVCATSATGPNVQDIVKETEIFRAHKAAPVVIVSASARHRFGTGLDVLAVPDCHPDLAFVLAAMAGHIFGYEAALSIDAQAQPLRQARAALEAMAVVDGAQPDLVAGSTRLEAAVTPALAGLRAGSYDGNLNASTASRLVSLLRYATGGVAVEGYEAEMGKVGSPSAIATDLLAVLGSAIDELTRPIDAIKHQAKTVTVGISRSEQALLKAALVAQVLATGATVEALGYRALRTLAALGPGVEEVTGFTRYRVEPAPGARAGAPLEGASIYVTDQGGVARSIPSRTAGDHTLRGTKHRAAERREVTVFRGLHDGRTGVMVPEVKDAQVTGLTLLHVRFADHLPAPDVKALLLAYQGRYNALVDAVTEAQPRFEDQVLGLVGLVELLTEPVAVLARHWAP